MSASARAEVLQGTLDLMVLKILDTMGSLHGYGIAQRVLQISENALQLNNCQLKLRIWRGCPVSSPAFSRPPRRKS